MSMFSDVYNGATNWLSKKYESLKGGVATVDKAQLAPTSSSKPKEAPNYRPPNKYSVDQYTYPIDLMSPSYGGNFVIFYINLSDESKFMSGQELYEQEPSADPAARASKIAQPFSKHQLAAGQGISTMVQNIGKGGTGILGKGMKSTKTSSGKDAKTRDYSNVIEGAGSALMVEVAANMSPANTRSYRRLATAIALHMPNQLNVRYATTWGTESSAALDMGARGIDGLGNVLSAAVDKSGAEKALSDLGGTARSAAANLALGKLKDTGLSSALGIAANPKQTQTFQGVEFRTFTFDYTFYPRDDFEAENIMNIIHMFKLHMHPEFKGENNYVWLYPSEFDIQYFTKGAENEYLHKHTSCVLENMQVNYTPNGNFTVFANGMPTQVNLSLTFKELQLASKETVGPRYGTGL